MCVRLVSEFAGGGTDGVRLVKRCAECHALLHFGGTVLIFWMSRPWKWVRVLTGASLGFSRLSPPWAWRAYLVDLVVALPYALAILALASNVRERRVPLMVGARSGFRMVGDSARRQLPSGRWHG